MDSSKLKYLLPIRSILFVGIFVVGSLIVGKELNEISNWWSIAATITNIVTILLIIFAAKRIKSSYAELINYKKKKSKAKQITLISLLILLVGTSGMYLAGFICYGKFPYAAPMMIAPIPLVLAILNFFVLPLTTPFAEDGLYLGCGVNSIKNKHLAILVPAFFYAVQHSFIPTLLDGKYVVYRFLSFFPLTIILCWYYREKKNPVPIMVGHALIEIASVVMILMTSMSPDIYQRMLDM